MTRGFAILSVVLCATCHGPSTRLPSTPTATRIDSTPASRAPAEEAAPRSAHDPFAAKTDLKAVFALDENTAYAIGEHGAIIRWNGARWLPQTSGTKLHLRGIWGSDATHLWAVGDNGLILNFDGKQWQVQPSTTKDDLWAISGLDARQIWAVGRGGLILFWNGDTWTQQPSGTNQGLFAVWASKAAGVWAAGRNLHVVRKVGDHFERVHGEAKEPEGDAPFLRGIWGSSADNIIAVGEPIARVSWDGVTWQTNVCRDCKSDSVEASDWLSSVWGSSANSVWMVGGGGVIEHRKNGRWELVSGAAETWLSSVHGSSDSDVWIVGSAATVLHWNGRRLTPYEYFP